MSLCDPAFLQGEPQGSQRMVEPGLDRSLGDVQSTGDLRGRLAPKARARDNTPMVGRKRCEGIGYQPGIEQCVGAVIR